MHGFESSVNGHISTYAKGPPIGMHWQPNIYHCYRGKWIEQVQLKFVRQRVWVSGWPNEWLNKWINEWVDEWVNEWINEKERYNEWTNEWKKERKNEWMNERKKERKNKWIFNHQLDNRWLNLFSYLFLMK